MHQRYENSLPAFAIRRPVTVFMIVITLLAIGIISWPLIPVDFTIRMDFPWLSVWIPYPNSSPEQVEKQIALPAEGEFRTLPQLKRISTSSDSNGCWIGLNFETGTNMKRAYRELQDAVERLRIMLPQEVEHILTQRGSLDRMNILRLVLFRAERQDDLALFARTHLKRRLLRIPGVAEVEIGGGAEESIYVDFNQEALRSLGLDLYQVIQSIYANSASLGAGRLEEGQTRYIVRTQGEFGSPEELSNTVISPLGIRLKEVAKISVHGPKGAENFSIDGKHGVFIGIIKEPGANVVATCDAVKLELDHLKQVPEFQGAEMLVLQDLGDIIRFALDGLMEMGLSGAVLTTIVLWLFLRRLRPTLVMLVSIPSSFLAGVLYIYFTGGALNVVTICALITSVGMLVDNAIVVMENIHRLKTKGAGDRESAIQGAAEVTVAVTTSTITTLIVFVPVFYMDAGELSIVMRQFAGPLAVTLVASLIFALTVIPITEVYLRKRKPRALAGAIKNMLARPARGRFYRWERYFSPFEFFRRGANRFLRHALNHRALVLMILVAAAALTYLYPYQALGFRGEPDIDIPRVRIRLNVDPNYGHERAKETMNMLVRQIEPYREALGIEHLYLDYGPWGGVMDLYLTGAKQGLRANDSMPKNAENVRKFLAKILPGHIPGGTMDFGTGGIRNDRGRIAGVVLRGNDTSTLNRLAEEFKRIMQTLPNLRNVESDRPKPSDEIQLHVQNERAAEAGITPYIIARSVDFALRGTYLPFIKYDGKEYPVRGQFDWTDGGNVGDLQALSVHGPSGKMVPLSGLVNMERGETPPRIFRIDGKSSIRLYGVVTEENLLQVRNALRTCIHNVELPEGYSIDLDEELQDIDKSMATFGKAMIMAVLLIYLVMAALFESWLLPLTVMMTIPLAFVGVYWTLFLTNTPTDLLSMVGSMLLCGVIVNNGIVIVDHINQLRLGGLSRNEAVLQGNHDRMRPVFMTALTTVVGIFPMAIGGGESADALVALGRALVGGLITGTLLTLFVVPLMYTLLDDVHHWTRDFSASLRSITLARPPQISSRDTPSHE